MSRTDRSPGRTIRRAVAAAGAAIVLLVALAAPAAARGPVAHTTIVRGYVPHASQWPWMTALLYSDTFKPQLTTDFDRQFCGGALVRPKVVLTAAHCIRKTGITSGADVDVLLGRRNLQETVGEKLDVAEVVVHPAYDPVRDLNDVAVLHLAAPSSLAPAAIIDPAVRLREGRRATVMGWGQLANAPVFSPVLRAADVPLWSPKRCRRAWKAEYFGSAMVCAGYLNGQVDSCQGDSGGPLMVLDRARGWQLIGVVSFGAKCAQPELPGVYACVNGPDIRPFILGEMAKDTTPAGAATAPETPGSQPTAPPGDDKTPPHIGTVTLGVAGGALVARFSLSEAAQLTAALYDGRGHKVRGPIRRGSKPGKVRIKLSGRLPVGRYRVVVRAVDLALNRSGRAVRFRVR